MGTFGSAAEGAWQPLVIMECQLQAGHREIDQLKVPMTAIPEVLAGPEVLAWRKSPHLSTLCVMSSSVIPLYVSSSFHTGFNVFLWVLVFSLLAWGMGDKGL